MSQNLSISVRRHGLGASFDAEETRKSQLLLEAQQLRARGEDQSAAERFAEAAAVEEELSARCDAQGLLEKSFVHQFSAASCWAQAGDFYDAIVLCDELLTRQELPPGLRRQVDQYAATLRARRIQWYSGVVESSMA